jgi:hypothetical protein
MSTLQNIRRDLTLADEMHRSNKKNRICFLTQMTWRNKIESENDIKKLEIYKKHKDNKPYGLRSGGCLDDLIDKQIKYLKEASLEKVKWMADVSGNPLWSRRSGGKRTSRSRSRKKSRKTRKTSKSRTSRKTRKRKRKSSIGGRKRKSSIGRRKRKTRRRRSRK